MKKIFSSSLLVAVCILSGCLPEESPKWSALDAKTKQSVWKIALTESNQALDAAVTEYKMRKGDWKKLKDSPEDKSAAELHRVAANEIARAYNAGLRLLPPTESHYRPAHRPLAEIGTPSEVAANDGQSELPSTRAERVKQLRLNFESACKNTPKDSPERRIAAAFYNLTVMEYKEREGGDPYPLPVYTFVKWW